MASYIQNSLIKNEKILLEAKISFWSLLPLILLGFIFILFPPISIILWVMAIIRYRTTELAFTDKRVIAKFGFISRKTIELNLAKVESVQVNQSIFGRILNYGTLVISGAGNPQAPILGISNPMVFRSRLNEHLHAD
ncbi:MAG: hypothetical protein COA69_03420 [Robiginitomaculum sp.]|nr:MAG: hypothetical protein COA69_03420 [Robiginitomaculum sp.]